MATVTTETRDFLGHNVQNNNPETNRQEIQAAIAKAVELRALHAALVQGNSPSNFKLPSSSPVSRPDSQFSTQDYPIFTPSYEDEPESAYNQIPGVRSPSVSEIWDEYGFGENVNETNFLSYYKKRNSSSRKGLPSDFSNLKPPQMCPSEDYKSFTASCANHITVLQTSPGTEFKSSRRNSLGNLKSVSSCNKWKPAFITSESESSARNYKTSNVVVPLTDSHSSVQSEPKSRGMMSWLFLQLKKKRKNKNVPLRAESEEASQVFEDVGIMSVENMKKELREAHKNRDAALMEVTEMKSSLGELRQKLENLESYCEELKRALKQATQGRNSQLPKKLENIPKRGKSVDGDAQNPMPVTEEVMVEGFFKIVSEARLSVKQFCKSLVGQIEENDSMLVESLNSLLQPHKLSLQSKHSKALLYHIEAIINQTLYQDFENCMFKNNGSPKHLDPQKDRQAQFSSFVALRNLSWNEVLMKGTKYFSEEFSKFCDQKMNYIITTLKWTRQWPEQLLQTFFVAAKCIWLLHLLAFSFNPPLGILRVEENRTFDQHYMEDMFMERQRSYGPNLVKILVMPGFYVQDRVLRCKVLCRYKSVS